MNTAFDFRNLRKTKLGLNTLQTRTFKVVKDFRGMRCYWGY